MADSNNPAADGTRAENMPEAQDQTYVVEEILLDGILDGVSMWLVKWQGYPLEECVSPHMLQTSTDCAQSHLGAFRKLLGQYTSYRHFQRMEGFEIP